MRNKTHVRIPRTYLATVYLTFLHHLTSRDQYYPKYHTVPGFLGSVPGFLGVLRVFWGGVPGFLGVPECSGVPGSTTCRNPEPRYVQEQ